MRRVKRAFHLEDSLDQVSVVRMFGIGPGPQAEGFAASPLLSSSSACCKSQRLHLQVPFRILSVIKWTRYLRLGIGGRT